MVLIDRKVREAVVVKIVTWFSVMIIKQPVVEKHDNMHDLVML